MHDIIIVSHVKYVNEGKAGETKWIINIAEITKWLIIPMKRL